MSNATTLQDRYVDARSDARRAEADRSKLLTAISHVEALFDAARRGDADGDLDTEIRDHLDIVATFEYDRWTVADAGIAAAGPTFEKFNVESPGDLGEVLVHFYRNDADEQFEDVIECVADAIAGGGEDFAPLTKDVEVLIEAFEGRDDERFHQRTTTLVDGFRDRDVHTAADLQDLLEAERGPFFGEDLLSLQLEYASRNRAIEDVSDAVAAGDAQAFVDARRTFDRTARALDAIAAAQRARLEDLIDQLTDEYPLDHGTPRSILEYDTPVLLTPTRLETRFRQKTDENGDPVTDSPSWELLVRIYPDDLHVDTHERGLTDAEVDSGARFWEHVWWASHLGDAAALEQHVPDRMLTGVELAEFPEDAGRRHAAVKERAWNAMAEQHGPERAAWIKRAMAPPNSDALLAGPPDNGHIADADVDGFEFEIEDLRGTVGRRPDSWTRPPRARLLPDQWIAFADTNGTGKTATSQPVSEPLSIGPDPGSLQNSIDTAEEHDDLRSGEIDWVFDFGAAEDAGMALRLDLTEDEVNAGVDRLTVVGVNTGLDEQHAPEALADLIEAHRYTDGLSVLERGTPTNDTREDGAGTAPSGGDSIYERECVEPAVSPRDAEADGAQIAALLGLGPDVVGSDRPFVFDRVPGAARSVEATAAATNAALWSATVGYYVPHLLASTDWIVGTSYDEWYQSLTWRRQLIRWLESYRRHFVSYVRAGGPVPPLRVDDQPYGIVPTTAFEDWESISGLTTVPRMDPALDDGDFDFKRYDDQDVPRSLSTLLGSLRGYWEAGVDHVPSVESPDDPEVIVSNLLSMAGTSYGYRLRDLIGDEAVAALAGPDAGEDEFSAARDAVGDQFRQATGRNLTPRIGSHLVGQHAPTIDAPVTSGDLPETLRALRTTRHDGLRTGPPGMDVAADTPESGLLWLWSQYMDGPERSLSELLCYHAILQEYRFARLRIGDHYEEWSQRLESGDAWDDAPWGLIPEPQVYGDDDRTMWHALADDVPDVLQNHPEYRDTWTIGDYIREIPAVDRPFAELLSAFETLESADQSVVDRTVRETLDLANHRFDAWATSLATRRLHGMRESGTDGLYLGAYGYVEDLQRETGDRTKGYIQAPSIDQATAAAVLRSAHDAETDEYGDLFAVDLSADRVREATWLLEGVRAGHSLGELVGGRFERALHEDYPNVELDQYIYAFRAIAPSVEGRLERDDMDHSDDVAAREVADGATLYELWRNDQIPWGTHVGPTAIDALPADDGNDAYQAIESELEAIERAFDSLSDLLAAEGVYQLVRDNPERAGAALDALSRGDAIEEVEVTETPRTGTSCTHRLVTLLDGTVTDGDWARGESPRAAAEPALEDWIETVLGDPTQVVCRVAYEPESPSDDSGPDGTEDGNGDDSGTDGDEDGSEEESIDFDWQIVAVRLSQLDLSALDVVSLVEGDQAAWGSELEARIEYFVKRTRSDAAPDGEMRLSFAPPSEWPDPEAIGADPATDVGFGVLLEVARSVRSVVSNGRPVDARDVAVPGEASDDGQVVGTLDARARTAVQRFGGALDALKPQVDLLAADSETGDRAIDDLIALVEAVEAVPTDGLEDARTALGRIDGTALEGDLAALAEAVVGPAALLARDEDGEVVLSPDDPVVQGLVDAGEDIVVELEEDGQQLDSRGVDAEDSGRFGVEFEPDELDPGDSVTVTVERESGATESYGARIAEERPRHELRLDALATFARVIPVLSNVEDASELVQDASGALDGDLVDDAVAALDPADWTGDAPADLGDVRSAASIPLPGFRTPDQWERVAYVARSVAENEASAELVRDAELDRNVPTVTTLDRLDQALTRGIGELSAATAAAARRPEQALIVAALETVRDSLLVCTDYGIHGSVPLSATGSSRADLEALARQGASVHEEATDMRENAEAHRNRGNAQNDPQAYVECLEALFGESFTVLVPFEPTSPGEFVNAIEPIHSDSLQAGDPLAVERWFDRIERVRDEAEQFGRALTYAETLGDRSPADGARFRVGQLPYRDPDTWVGLPEAWADEHPSGRLSLVAHVHGVQSGGSYVGLFVDEFVETVPNETETTGLSVHYDRPTNQAPQSMLLAVPPTEENWSMETLADVVEESIDMAKLRTVDRDALDALGHLLPGLTLPTNESEAAEGPDTASVDPQDLMADWRLYWEGEN